jgi:hypothetical protein
VLDARREREPQVASEIVYWENVQLLLGQLDLAVRSLRDDEGRGLPPEVAKVADLDVPELSKAVTQTLAALADVRARVSRKTINIGVSGRVHNGKSTLLQALSGLGEEQIPTGRGGPVTAVRSTMYHSLTEERAVLAMHTESSFCEQILAPYHAELRLPAPPRSAEEFVDYPYPATAADLTGLGGPGERQAAAPLLARLREMHQSLPFYRKYLAGERRDVELPDLRSWVAYPKASEDAGVPDRRYLAVRNATITCRFPLDEAISLGLTDLPGLGELVADAEEHHLTGLVNDVDFVIMIKRPTDNNAHWAEEDNRAALLTARAAGAAGVRDFLMILINSGGCHQENIVALQRELTDRVNEGEDGRFYQVITADAADRDAVREQVLGAALDHLASALPRMDAAVIEHARDASAACRAHLLATAERLLSALRTLLTPTATQELITRSRELHNEVTVSLQAWIAQLQERAAEDYVDDEFAARVTEVRSAVKEWILNGFGEGTDEWTAQALAAMRLNKAAASFAEHALNGIRVEIARRLSDIDDVLLRRRREFWAGLLSALGPRLTQLADDADGPEAGLRSLAERLRDAPDACPALAGSLDQALDVRLDYRTRVLPQVRQALEILLPQPGFGRGVGIAPLLDVPLNAEGAEQIYSHITDLASEGLYDASKVLAREPSTTGLVLFAYGEQFEDSFIRSQDSEAEFLRLTEAFRDQLWPDMVTGPMAATARVQRARAALVGLRRALDGTDATALGGNR